MQIGFRGRKAVPVQDRTFEIQRDKIFDGHDVVREPAGRDDEAFLHPHADISPGADEISNFLEQTALENDGPLDRIALVFIHVSFLVQYLGAKIPVGHLALIGCFVNGV